MTEWIKTTERQPEKSGVYLIVIAGMKTFITTAVYSEKWFMNADTGLFCQDNVTYWAQMPELPEGD